MISAASDGLDLLCDEALRECGDYEHETDALPPPKRKRTHNKRVSFSERDDVKEYQPLDPIDPIDQPDQPDPLPDADLEQRLDEAEFNTQYNRFALTMCPCPCVCYRTNPFRYHFAGTGHTKYHNSPWPVPPAAQA